MPCLYKASLFLITPQIASTEKARLVVESTVRACFFRKFSSRIVVLASGNPIGLFFVGLFSVPLDLGQHLVFKPQAEAFFFYKKQAAVFHFFFHIIVFL